MQNHGRHMPNAQLPSPVSQLQAGRGVQVTIERPNPPNFCQGVAVSTTTIAEDIGFGYPCNLLIPKFPHFFQKVLIHPTAVSALVDRPWGFHNMTHHMQLRPHPPHQYMGFHGTSCHRHVGAKQTVTKNC